MKTRLGMLLVGLTALVFACAPQKAPAPSAEKPAVAHPELSEDEKLIACSECHKEATPEVYEEWFKSRHGLAMVKCFQCHGTFETFHEVTRETCRTCHAKAYDNCPKDKMCWECHSPHFFKRHAE